MTIDEQLKLGLFLQAPVPSKEEIESQLRLDMARNPHGDSYKPERRSVNRIIAEHKVKWVAEHIKAFHDTNLWLEATRR